MKSSIELLIIVAALFLNLNSASAKSRSHAQTNPIDTRAYLEKFHKDPKRVMNTPLAKWDERGRAVPRTFTSFGGKIPSYEEMASARGLARERLCVAGGRSCDAAHPRAIFGEKNQVELFLIEPDHLRTLAVMEEKGLMHGQVPRAPWSDSFWPMQKGVIARRWLDRGFPDSRTFIDNYNYYLSNPPSTMPVNSMSPAEKYDLLVGDYSFALTSANWSEGRLSWDQKGAVPGWAGICHGWAPASIMMPAPKRSVTVPAASGTLITFYPSDIKGLASAAWGNAPPKNFFVGNRCNVSRPKEDAMGRVIDPGCFDVNPGTWHMAVVNEIGYRKRSFVIDAQYDFQIWNYPLYSYRYNYFNPQTLETSENLGGSIVKIESFTIDKFKKYRNPQAKYVVGIAMEISYAIETAPSTKPLQKPRLHAVKMLYDVELDGEGAIVGGEWYSNFHPDFIWHFAPTSRALSIGEKAMSEAMGWDGASPLPLALQDAARKSSSHGQPLATVVETLVRLSQQVD